jgi:phosphopantothenoylcysteine decarboxylase/phosphopantothenate--cysteine ligase
MGYAIAKNAMRRGAQVTLVTAKTEINPPEFVQTIEVVTAEDMLNAVLDNSDDADIIIKAAAVADYRPVTTAENKIKKSDGDAVIQLERTTDILKTLGERKKANQIICGFSMETENLLENSRKKLEKKNIDMIVANNLKVEGAGFGTDTNVVTIIMRDKEISLEKMSKDEVASRIFDVILEYFS